MGNNSSLSLVRAFSLHAIANVYRLHHRALPALPTQIISLCYSERLGGLRIWRLAAQRDDGDVILRQAAWRRRLRSSWRIAYCGA